MHFLREPVWRSPEEIIEIAFQRAPVVMMNEAHDGWKRCIRTRKIGQRIVPVAHQAGVRHLAMEALYLPIVADQCNRLRRVPDDVTYYPSQPEMRDFIQSALDLGWTLIPYEAEAIEWLLDRHTIELSNPDDFQEAERVLLAYQVEIASVEFTNWREERQARNILKALNSLPENSPLLIWCGNSHQSKKPDWQWIPMGYQFKKLSGMDPFVIDQTRTVKFNNDRFRSRLIKTFRDELLERGGTAGFLNEEAPFILSGDDSSNALLLSTENELE